MNNYSVNVEPSFLDDYYFEDENYSPHLDPDGTQRLVPPDPDVNEPTDRWKAVFITFYVLGMLTLLPWNFFVTANDYWMYKFRELNATNSSDVSKTELQVAFTSYISMAATGPPVLLLIINSMYGHRVSIQRRVEISMLLILLSFVLTATLVKIDTDKWQTLFFGITLGTVVVVNVSSALLQAVLWSLASKFPSRFTTALISGQALGGIFCAGANVFSLLLGASSVMSALMYFIIANVTIIAGLVSYAVVTTKSIFYNYHAEVKNAVKSLQHDPTDSRGVLTDHFSFKKWMKISKKVKFNGAAACLCFVVSISVFPALTVLVVPEGKSKNDWNDKFFVPVISFLVFNCCDYAGRVFSGYTKWPLKNSVLIFALSIFRMAFVPLILLCNLQPRYHLPVLIHGDAYFITLICLFAFTNGYLINISLMNVPSMVQPAEQETASSMMALFVGLGCAIGSLISYGLVKVL